MIVGIGTDVCSIDRIAAALKRHGDRFAQRVLGPEEWRVFEARRARVATRGLSYLATRFAAKEAFSKAIGLGINAGHDLNRDNLTDFLRAVPGVQEVSIGHALIADALELGYTETVRDYLRCIHAAA
jgi:pyridoxine 5-phosphate synthase